jgi:hypothetical protein
MHRLSRKRRWLAAILVTFVFVSLGGFVILPPIIKAQLERRLSATLGRTVTVGRVRVNPYRFSLAIEDFDIREADGQRSFLGWNRLAVSVSPLASLTGDWTLRRVELDGFHADATINPDRTYNFSDVLARVSAAAASAPGAKPKPPRPVRISTLLVAQARFGINDRSHRQPFASVVGPVTFTLTNFRTAGAEAAPYHFEAVTEAGEKLAWTGTLAADPLSSQGDFAIENLVLKKYTPYFADLVRADLTDGQLTLRGRYTANFSPGSRVLKLSGGEFHLRNFALNERSPAQPVLELPILDVSGVDADALALKASVGSISIQGGRLRVRRNPDGTLNLLGLLPPAGPAAVPATAPALDFVINQTSWQSLALEIADLAAPRPVHLELDGLEGSVGNLTFADGASLPVRIAFNWAPRGTVKISGQVKLRPTLQAELKTEVLGLTLLPLSPYLERFMNARLTQGTVTEAGTVTAGAAGGGPAFKFSGDIKVEDFGLVDSAHNQDLAGFGSLALSGLNLATAPQLAVTATEIDVAQPYARVLVNADSTINLAALAKPGGPAAASPAPQLRVGRIVMTGANFSYTDRSIEPNVRIALDQFGGTVSGLGSDHIARGDVDLHGTVDGLGAVSVTGKLDPLGSNRAVALKVAAANVDLTPLSPYAGKFAGYELARGQLAVTTDFRLQGNALDATNLVVLNQFNFGAATNNPAATGLPVRLGVALLKDLDGKIVIDLPVQGQLNDPNFRVGKVVLRVVVNLLTKAAISPFSLIGSMFGGGGDELAFQEFAPGSPELQPAERPKLDVVAKALTNRPALSLAIEGAYDAGADAYALKRLKLAALVRGKIWEARRVAEPNLAPPGQLVIAPADYAAMVKTLFDQQFPPGTKFGTPLPAPPPVAAPPAPPPGLLRRLAALLTFQARRERRQAEKENERRAAGYAQAASAARAAGLPQDEMIGRLAEALPVTDDDLRSLANARARQVRDQLLAAGHLAPDRLFLTPSRAGGPSRGPRVFLTLQ